MWQYIAVGIVGVGVCFYLLWKIYSFIVKPPKAGDCCSGCTGCTFKDQIKEKKECNSMGVDEK